MTEPIEYTALTLPAIAYIFGRHQQGQARSLQKHIGPSEVGDTCELRLAYKLAGTAPVNVEPLKWAALVGTWGHAGAEGAMREENERLGRERYLIEDRAKIGHELVPGGNTDVYDTDTEEVVDWKFIGQSSMAKYKAQGPSQLYRVQANLYGLGWARSGRTVKGIRIAFLPRWSNDINDGFVWRTEYDEKVALDALARLETTNAKLMFVHNGMSTWDSAFERDEKACKFCPFRRRGPSIDETGCYGWHGASEDLDTLAGIGLDGQPAPDALTLLIRKAQHPDALVGLWRDAASRGTWTEAHTAEAAVRKAALLAMST